MKITFPPEYPFAPGNCAVTESSILWPHDMWTDSKWNIISNNFYF